MDKMNSKSVMNGNEYLARLDGRGRITLKEAGYSFYNVKNYRNGCISLKPVVLHAPHDLSTREINQISEEIAAVPVKPNSVPINIAVHRV